MLTTQLWSGPCYLPAEQCHTTTAWPRAVEDTDKLGLAFTRVFSETPSPLHWGSLALLCLATSRNNIQQAETKPETAVRGRTEGSQRQKQQTFLWVVMVQARKSLKLSHQRTRGKPFPSISLFVFFFLLAAATAQLLFGTHLADQRFLQAENWLTWARDRRSPDTTGRIYSSACGAAPLVLQHWKYRQVVVDKIVNRRKGSNGEQSRGLRETIWIFPPSLILPPSCCWVQSTTSDLRWRRMERQEGGNRKGRNKRLWRSILALSSVQKDARAQILQC